MTDNIAFTPETLGRRWQCSHQHIRDLVNKGKLPAFRVGRLYRIPYDAVIAFENPKEAEDVDVKPVIKAPLIVMTPQLVRPIE
ncbi:helix-turn-helix domain-containing protein [Phyllobacterium salinisoli]|uniref:Helix-turn-helix domain-containing protein n=1 Tax=Phyllobacterium salinisoli TaxID=1899321 RepID=A0A368K2F3_9HYPH|nr:excisionase family DNA-binding protein [Phyllobacterium salinisoli]RCS23568.1 helix-turn-helix domain-containing protein [Phyllobacterium salinisoli]